MGDRGPRIFPEQRGGAQPGCSSQRTGEGGQASGEGLGRWRGLGMGAPSSGVPLADRSWAWSRWPGPCPAPLSCAVLGVNVWHWTEASGQGGECLGLDTLEGRTWWGWAVGIRSSHCCGHHPGLCPPRHPQNENRQGRQGLLADAGLRMLCPPHPPTSPRLPASAQTPGWPQGVELPSSSSPELRHLGAPRPSSCH